MVPPQGRKLHRHRTPPSGARALMIMFLAVLGLGAAGVAFILPGLMDKSPKKTLTGAAPAAQPDRPAVPATGNLSKVAPRPSSNGQITEPGTKPFADPNKAKAELLLGNALQRQARLENEGVKTWGAAEFHTSYPKAQAALKKATDDIDTQRFLGAIEGFQNAIDLLDRLAANKAERYRRAISAGDVAIQKNMSDEAEKQYNIAQAIRPGDAMATAGLARALNLPQVLAKMLEAEKHESSGQLAEALRAYLAARSLDAAFAPAQRNADRVAALIQDRDYRRAISETLAALDKDKLRAAAQLLEKAAQIRPKAPEISDLRRRIRLSRQLATLNRLRGEAETHERLEQWEDAIKLYDKALRIDQTAAFAVRGKAAAKKFAQLHRQIETYLNEPERLNSPEPLAHATQVLTAVETLGNPGPKLKTSRDRLRTYISQALKPSPVLLQSDAKTSVTVYRVGRFGPFREKRLTLRPGQYTAVGSRSGYRDVRILFRVGPAKSENIIVIKCTERI